MSKAYAMRSLLAVDVGTSLTHAALIEPVEGTYRLLARADVPSLADPIINLSDCVARGIAPLQDTVGRALLDADRAPIVPASDQGGADALVVTTSAAPALRCALIGLSEQMSVPIGAAAIRCSNGTLGITVRLDAGRAAMYAGLASIRNAPPEIIVMVGGVDGGPTRLLEDAARTLATLFRDVEPAARPCVVFAGNPEARRPIARALGPDFDFRAVENVLPAVDRLTPDDLELELAQLYDEKLRQLPGYEAAHSWASVPITASHTGIETIWRYLAGPADDRKLVLGIDVGGSGTTAGWTDDRQISCQVANLGIAEGLPGLLGIQADRHIVRWAPIPDISSDCGAWLHNRALRPAIVPTDTEELAVLQAAACAATRHAMHCLWTGHGEERRAEGSVYDLLALRGGILAGTYARASTLLTYLNAAEPVGIVRMVVDWAGLWPTLGALAKSDPHTVAGVLAHDGLLELGTAVSLTDGRRPGLAAAHVKLMQDGKTVAEGQVKSGELRRFALDEHVTADLEIRPEGDVQVGLAPPGRPVRRMVRGGHWGIVIDARGRPLTLPEQEDERQEKMQIWLESLS